MNQKQFIGSAIVSFFMVFCSASCNNNSHSTDAGNTSPDSSSSITISQSKTGQTQWPQVHLGINEITNSLDTVTLPNTIPGGAGTTYNLRQLAKDCITSYRGSYRTAPLTTSVSFGEPSFKKWIDSMHEADEISLEFGIYSEPFLKAIKALYIAHRHDDLNVDYPDVNVNALKGRVSVFLFAYKRKPDGTLIDFTPSNNIASAYNLGNLHP